MPPSQKSAESAGGSAKTGPIIVELTAVEAQGYNLAGNAQDDGIETHIRLILTAGGMNEPTANFMAQKLAKGAVAARAKIEAATRFEIRVTATPKASTLLPKAKKKKSKTSVT